MISTAKWVRCSLSDCHYAHSLLLVLPSSSSLSLSSSLSEETGSLWVTERKTRSKEGAAVQASTEHPLECGTRARCDGRPIPGNCQTPRLLSAPTSVGHTARTLRGQSLAPDQLRARFQSKGPPKSSNRLLARGQAKESESTSSCLTRQSSCFDHAARHDAF